MPSDIVCVLPQHSCIYSQCQRAYGVDPGRGESEVIPRLVAVYRYAVAAQLAPPTSSYMRMRIRYKRKQTSVCTYGTYTKDDIYFVGITACIHVRAKDTLYVIIKLYT